MVVTLLEPTAELKPGLSTTAKITTATRARVYWRFPSRLSPSEKSEKDKGKVKRLLQIRARQRRQEVMKQLRRGNCFCSKTSKKKEEQGVFILRDGKRSLFPSPRELPDKRKSKSFPG